MCWITSAAASAPIFLAGVAHQTEHEAGGEQIAGVGRIDQFMNRECRHRDDAVFRPRRPSRCG
jgi:hypothetical protein